MGDDVVVNEDVDEWEPKLLITDPCDSVTVSEFKPTVTVSKFKPGKQGLNSRVRPVLRGGGMVLTHYLITWLVMYGQLGTRDGSSSRPGALLEIFSFSKQIAVRLTKYIHCFCDWVRRHSQVPFPAIQQRHQQSRSTSSRTIRHYTLMNLLDILIFFGGLHVYMYNAITSNLFHRIFFIYRWTQFPAFPPPKKNPPKSEF